MARTMTNGRRNLTGGPGSIAPGDRLVAGKGVTHNINNISWGGQNGLSTNGKWLRTNGVVTRAPAATGAGGLGNTTYGNPWAGNGNGNTTPGLTGLAAQLAAGNLPDRFQGFKIGENTGKIIDTTVGAGQSNLHMQQYQKLFNAARLAGLNITGGKGTGGMYDPLVLYRQGGDKNRYVDMRTGITNPTSTGASAGGEGTVSPAVLQRLRANAGYNEDAARASAGGLGVNDRYPYIPAGGGPRNTPIEQGGTGMDPQVAALAGMGANPAAGTGGGATNMSTPNGGTPTGGPSYGGYTSTQNDAATPNSPGAQGGRRIVGHGRGSAGNAPTYGGGESAMMPPTANFEAANRGIEDQLSAQLASLGVAREQIPAEIARIMARITTDQTYGLQGLQSDLGERGLTLPGAGAYLLQRDVALPSGRAAQDAALEAAQNYSNLSANEGAAYLQASQGTVEALLQRAQELIDSMPLGLSQSRGNLQTQRRNNRRRNNRRRGRNR